MRSAEDPRAHQEFASFLESRGYGGLPDAERERLWEAFAWAWIPGQPQLRIVLDGPPAVPGERAGRFVEVEDEAGRSVRSGRWRQDGERRWVLEITPSSGGARPA